MSRPGNAYSIGKVSSVMLHLVRKAFYSGAPPFPLTHVNTCSVASTATTLPELSGRAIDHDQAGSMEKKKREGYF